MWDLFMGGATALFTLQNIFFIVFGVGVGIVLGSIPGFTATLSVAVMLPFTFYLDPVPAISLLMGIYKGATYGGSISAILIGMPGTPAATATVLDGHELAKQGKSGKALKMAVTASVIGDTFSDLVLIFVAIRLARVALNFGPPEIATLLLFSLTIIGAISGKSILKGIISGLLGVFLAFVGMDPMVGVTRFTFGSMEFLQGLSFIPMMVGMYGISEVLIQGMKSDDLSKVEFLPTTDIPEDNRLSFKEVKASIKTILQSSVIGTFIGILPGIGAAVAAFLSYGVAKRGSKNPENYGKGELNGVAASEAGNNAVCGATLIPLLTFGIPGDVITAVILGALMIQGITPGPHVFRDHGIVLYAIFIGMLVANFTNFILGSVASKYFPLIAAIPKGIVFPIIVVLCAVGSFGVNNNPFDLLIMVIFGILGFVMRRADYPLAPFNIAFILGPKLEFSIRQSLLISSGNWSVFFTRPIALVFLLLFFVIVIGLSYTQFRARNNVVRV